jgi:hypothetical protein
MRQGERIAVINSFNISSSPASPWRILNNYLIYMCIYFFPSLDHEDGILAHPLLLKKISYGIASSASNSIPDECGWPNG